MAETLISIVTGTFNRLASLQRMMQSAIDSIPIGINYEFVIVDGGSTDGTLAWLRDQPGITLIEHGELRGAIPAFCDGAKAAQGEYVLLANDDIVFTAGSIVRALVHLESHPECGAVAFADNRPAPGYAPGIKVQTITALDSAGKPVSVPYPQVGLIRKWLGDLAGWWGADDPIMAQGHTYGGDNYLGARIWEQGYTVDAVAECWVEDHVISDGLRQRNERIEQQHPAMYYKRYATPPRIAAAPQVNNPQSERLRILYLPIFEPYNPAQKANKRGLREALSRRGIVYEVDYLNVPFDLPALVSTFQPHLLLSQLHSAKEVTPPMMLAARECKPDMVVANWNGDAHVHSLTSESMLALLKHIDLQLVVNAHVLPIYEGWGIKAAYWQIGFEEPLGELPTVQPHDIVFLGNNNNRQRVELEATLTAAAAANHASFGLYGGGWKNAAGSTLYDFAAGEAIYQGCKIAVGDQFWNRTVGFVSNRMFQALAAGAFFLQQTTPQLEEWNGLKDGVHYVSWADFDDLHRKIAYWLSPRRAAKRKQIAAAGQAYVREHFSFDAQVDKLFNELLPLIEREGGT